MIHNWLSFQISLPDLNQFLKDNIPKANGVYANPEQFEIVESEPFDDQDRQAINNYLNNLQPE